MLRYLLNFFYPPRCASCATRLPIDTKRHVCEPCLGRIERLVEPICERCGMPLEPANSSGDGLCHRCVQMPPKYGVARAAARYRASGEEQDSTLPSIIRRHKYGLDQSLARALAECIGEAMPFAPGSYDVVIPVPLHGRRLRWRGFNQAALLGAVVARRLECPLDAASLRRVKSTTPQTAKDLDTRRRNVHRAFAVKRPDAIANRRVLLVDDVMTTGATVDECARTLLAAGARSVDVFTLARAL